MTIASILYLLAFITFVLMLFGVTLGTVPMIALGLAFTALGLFVSTVPFNRTVR